MVKGMHHTAATKKILREKQKASWQNKDRTRKTTKGLRYRLRQLLEAGNSSAQAAKRLGISNQEVLEHLQAMSREHPTTPGTAGRREIDRCLMEDDRGIRCAGPFNHVGAHLTENGSWTEPSRVHERKVTIKTIKADIAREREEDTKRSHTTPVYKRTCEDALALLNLETMSLESRVRLTSQMISDTLRRWPTHGEPSSMRARAEEEHKHRFITDEDGVIHPCACGAKWKPTPGQST